MELVELLPGHDFRLAPHIAARQVRDRHHLADLAQQLNQHSVRAVFFPAGDVTVPLGKYHASLDLLRDLADTVADAELGVGGFYLFSFNRVEATVQWREDMLRRLEVDSLVQQGVAE